MRTDQLIAEHPTVFHMASAAAWPSIRQHGLLTTAQLVDLYGLEASAREQVLSSRRAETITLRREGFPPVLIRDQKPMKFIDERIESGSSLAAYLSAINSRVFFWPTHERLLRLLRAKEYRRQPQIILRVDTSRLIERHGERIELCRFNSGAVTQKNHPSRGHRSWIPVTEYPYDDYRRRFGARGALAEVTVRDGVPDVLDLTLEVHQVNESI